LWDKREHHGIMHNLMKNDSVPQNPLSQRTSLPCDSYAGRVAHWSHDFNALQGQSFTAESRQESDSSCGDAPCRMAGSDPVVHIGKAMPVIDLRESAPAKSDICAINKDSKAVSVAAGPRIRLPADVRRSI
jgi:hypothetical protein